MSDSECPLVSVIIPVYNVKPYLNEALDSVINQTYNNLEIIVIDDGSTDGSETICDEYAAKDSRIKLIHQENQGLSAARNKGLDIMQGTIVSFLDSDDAFNSKMIEIMASAMLQEDVDMVICKYSTIYSEQKMRMSREIQPALSRGMYNNIDILCAFVDRKLNISVWNKLYKAQLWENRRFPNGQEYEDIAVFPIYYDILKTCMLSDSLYLHRIHSGTITTTPTLKRFIDWKTNYEIYEAFIEKHIPEIFNQQHEQKVQQQKIKNMIAFYVLFSQQKVKKEILISIREKILDTPKEKLSSFYVACVYQVFRFFPQLFDVIYPIYAFIVHIKICCHI